jgi:hypothetical protein
VWTAFPSSDYYALSATLPASVLQIRALAFQRSVNPSSYFPSAFASLGELPVFDKQDSNEIL